MMQPIFTQDLCIRPFENADAPAFVAAVRESAGTVGAWLPWCHAAYSEQDAYSWFDSCKHNMRCETAYDAGIFSPDGKELYGGISINQINRQNNIGSVGYWVRETVQRRGIATRATQMMVNFRFAGLKLTRLEIAILPDNRASRHVAENAGATFECIARNRLFAWGSPHAAALYSLVPSTDTSFGERFDP